MRILTHKDAEYLEKYIEICEDFTSKYIDEEDANIRLQNLNEEFECSLNDGIQKTKVLGAEEGIDPWESSSLIC